MCVYMLVAQSLTLIVITDHNAFVLVATQAVL
jgi:hypothetical protein